MWKAVKRWWKYFAMKLHMMHEEKADPKVVLEQTIDEAERQDRELRDLAATVIANQKQAQVRLDRAVAKYERASSSAEQALLLADREGASGDAERSAKLNDAATSLAGNVLALEREIGELEQQLLQATQAADNARAEVQRNGARLTQAVKDKEKLVGQIDQTQLQEKINATMDQLSRTVGDGVPTLTQVAQRIEARQLKANARAELDAGRASSTVDATIIEIEHAQEQAEAEAWLSERRAKLGLSNSGSTAQDGQVEPTAQ